VTDKTPFLVMGYAPNGTLRQRHPKGTRLPLPTIIPYVRQIADALQYAHDKKLVHRDIKPENMLLGQHNEVLLSDFGIALITQSSRNQSTQDIVGTVSYMSPEQIQGKPRAASDQYSLGIVVYEWLCGDHPFHGSFTELCTQHLFASPPSLTEKVPTIDAAIEDILAVALAKDPKQRFRSISAFAHALQQAADEKLAPPSIYVPQLSNHQSPDSLLLSQLEPVAKVSHVPDPYQASAPTLYSSPQDPPRNAVLPSPRQHRLNRRFSWSVGGSLGLISLLIVLTLIFKLTAFVPGVPSTIQPTTNPTATSPTTGCAGTTNDNFSDSLQPVWTWTDPGGNATKSVSQGFLNITVPDGNDLAPSTNYNAPRLLQPINSTSFSAETLVKIPSNFTEGYQGAGLLFWQDTQNFLRLERGTGGIIFDQNLNGNYTHLATGLSTTTALQVELHLQRNSNAWTAFWREPGQTWQQVGTATVTLSPLSIGLTAIANYGVSTVSAQYDYFRVTCN